MRCVERRGRQYQRWLGALGRSSRFKSAGGVKLEMTAAIVDRFVQPKPNSIVSKNMISAFK